MLLIVTLIFFVLTVNADNNTCGEYKNKFLPAIWEDLTPWATTRVTQQHVDAMMVALKAGHKTESGKCGARFVIVDNKVLVDVQNIMKPLCSGAGESYIAVYAELLHELSNRFRFPDTTFVVSLSDFPDADVASHAWHSELLLPVFRFCRTYDSPEILIPNHYLFLERIWEEHGPHIPFAERKSVVHAGYSVWAHMQLATSHLTDRWNDRNELDLNARKSLQEWAASLNDPRLDIARGDMLPVKEWSRYKYIAHMDGLTCSSKFEKSFRTGSLLFVEQSGFFGYATRLLTPYVHYVPFYRHFPQELLDVLNWAESNPESAASIAESGRQEIDEVTTLGALECQVYLAITEYTKLLSGVTFNKAGTIGVSEFLKNYVGGATQPLET